MDVSRNRLRELPEDLSYMASLTHMDCATNRIGHLPRDIGNCIKVHYSCIHSCIHLSVNSIYFCPASSPTHSPHSYIMHNTYPHTYTQLKYLDINTNILVFLPHSFSKLENLEIANFERNELIMQPDRLSGCR